ncbi:MAG: glycosyltransferase family 2 protein [Acidobacteriia bacterium]|nr:glycosyltransferase family 2 protein [Terriglobia bacterium]
MLLGQRIIVILPAFNAEKTLAKTVSEIDREIVDEIVLVDDGSTDGTVQLAESLHLKVHRHTNNLGYGGNQKTCFREALKLRADIVVMVHPDYQYTPRLVPAMASMLVNDVYDVVLASRILGGTARSGGMPLYKYVSNRFLTLLENWMIGMKLSEYHTGYRAYTRKVLTAIPYEKNSDDFIFDNQILIQAKHFGFRFGEISCPTRYFEEASSINFWRSMRYGWACLYEALRYRLDKWGIARYWRLQP